MSPAVARMPVAAPSEAARAQALAPVLPAQARPHGYSLDAMAGLLAGFNVGDRSAAPPNTPFQVLYLNAITGATDFSVAPGTALYVPVLFSDNSAPVIGNFPADPTNRAQLLHYWFSQTELGITSMEVAIDGKIVPLGAGYVSGVAPATPLPDGATLYATAGAFIAPLAAGVHTVAVRAKATGDALRRPEVAPYFPDGMWTFSITYRVTVR